MSKKTDKPEIPVTALTSTQVDSARSHAGQYLGFLHAQTAALGAADTAKNAKFATIQDMGRLACAAGTVVKDGQNFGTFDRLLACSIFDATKTAFQAALVAADILARTVASADGSPTVPAAARNIMEIDAGLRPTFSVIRSAILAGHVIAGTETRGDLQKVAGNVTSSGPRQPVAKPEPSAAKPEPAAANVSDMHGIKSVKLATLMRELGAVALASTEHQQDVLASCLIDALADFRSTLNAAVAAPQVAPAVEPMKKASRRKAA